jgi:hypothetical protein
MAWCGGSSIMPAMAWCGGSSIMPAIVGRGGWRLRRAWYCCGCAGRVRAAPGHCPHGRLGGRQANCRTGGRLVPCQVPGGCSGHSMNGSTHEKAAHSGRSSALRLIAKTNCSAAAPGSITLPRARLWVAADRRCQVHSRHRRLLPRHSSRALHPLLGRLASSC